MNYLSKNLLKIKQRRMLKMLTFLRLDYFILFHLLSYFWGNNIRHKNPTHIYFFLGDFKKRNQKEELIIQATQILCCIDRDIIIESKIECRKEKKLCHFYFILLCAIFRLLSSFIYFYTNKIQSPFDIIKFYMKKVRQKIKFTKKIGGPMF